MRSKKGQERTVSNLCHDEADCTMRNGHDELRPSPSRENAPLQLGHHSVSPLQHHFDPLTQSHHYQHTPKMVMKIAQCNLQSISTMNMKGTGSPYTFNG